MPINRNIKGTAKVIAMKMILNVKSQITMVTVNRSVLQTQRVSFNNCVGSSREHFKEHAALSENKRVNI